MSGVPVLSGTRALRRWGLFLAWSPWIYALLAAPFCIFQVLGSGVVAAAVLYAPLLIFILFRPNSSLVGTTILWVALATSLWLIPATLMGFAPHYLLNADSAGPNGVTIAPERQDPHWVRVSGLNMRYAPVLEKSSDGLPYQFLLGVTFRGGETKGKPPRQFEDGYGNSLDFSQIDKSTVHLADNRGGFADIRWEGDHFSVIAARSAGKTDAARGPTAGAVWLASQGTFLAMLAPLLGWLGLTLYVFQEQARRRQSNGLTTASMALQALGVVIMVWLFTHMYLFESHAGDEMAGIGAIFFGLCWLTCSAAGLALFTKQFAKEACPLEEECRPRRGSA